MHQTHRSTGGGLDLPINHEVSVYDQELQDVLYPFLIFRHSTALHERAELFEGPFSLTDGTIYRVSARLNLRQRRSTDFSPRES